MCMAFVMLFCSFVYWSYEEDRKIPFLKEYVETNITKMLPDIVLGVGDVRFRISKDYRVQLVIMAIDTHDLGNKLYVKVPRIEIDTDVWGTLFGASYKVRTINIVRPTSYLNLHRLQGDDVVFMPSYFYKAIQENAKNYIPNIEQFFNRVEDHIRLSNGKLYVNSDDELKKIDIQMMNLEKVNGGVSMDVDCQYNGEKFGIFTQFVSNAEKQFFIKMENFNFGVLTDSLLNDDVRNHSVSLDGSLSMNFDVDNRITGVYLGIRKLNYQNRDPLMSTDYGIEVKDSVVQIRKDVLFAENFNLLFDNMNIGGSLYTNLITNDTSGKVKFDSIEFERVYRNWAKYDAEGYNEKVRKTLLDGLLEDFSVEVTYKHGTGLKLEDLKVSAYAKNMLIDMGR